MVLFFLSFCLVKSYAAYDEKYLNKDFAPTYYDGLNLNQDSESFKKDLSVIISTGYVRKGYSELATLYKTSDIDPNDPTKVICLYTKNSLDNTSAAVGGWDREHVWAKSHGFPAEQTYVENDVTIKYENTDPYTDAHHLRPATATINRTRYDYDFGELDETAVLNYEDEFGNKICKDLRTFEPADHCKGDVARMLLYMDTRYGFTYPFNLKLVDDAHTTGTNGNGRVGNLQTLLKWHYQDPVDNYEIYRNNVIYDTWQHNRNPYIDHPEYVSIAYPNNYDTGAEPTKVESVIALINALPSVITKVDVEKVNQAKLAYDALNLSEKEQVTNVDVLNLALEQVKVIHMGDFIELSTKASLKIAYDEALNPIDVDIRFGGMLDLDFMDDIASYGVVVTTDWFDEVSSSVIEKKTMADFLTEHNTYKNMVCTPVKVNSSSGVEHYQFAWVINDMEGNYNTTFKAFMYMEYNGNLYLSQSVSYSVVSLARYYYENRIELDLTEEQVQVIERLASMGTMGDTAPGDVEKDFFS